jgi:hypothetical protein
MKRRKTSLNVNELFPFRGRRQKKEREKVQDEKGRPVRGGVFYAQLCPSGQTQQYKYRLEHAQTVPQAITAMQVLKDSQQKGTLLPPTFQKKQYTEENQEKNGHTIGEAIADYREHRDLLELFDPLTRVRQNNSLNKWDKKFGKLPLANLNGLMRSDFAVSGRTIDNDMSALKHVV